MTNHQLLDMIGDSRGEFLLEAQAHREAQPKVKRLNRKRVWLIAAVVALMLLLVGCAAVILGLRELSVGTFYVDSMQGETQTRELLSLQGYEGSPGYQATKEWLAFTKEYDQDHRLMQFSPYDDYVEPKQYRLFNCYTEEMVVKLDEILEKYHLRLPQKLYLNVESEELFQAVGISRFFNDAIPTEHSLYAGYHYDDGAFLISGNTTLLGMQSPFTISYQYSCMRKGTFYDIYGSLSNLDSYAQWNYTTDDGTQLLLALSGEDARIIADKDNCFVSVHVLGIFDGDTPLGMLTMDQRALEAFANSFDFSYTLQVPDREAADQRETAREEALTAQQNANSMTLYEYGPFLANAVYTGPEAYCSLIDLGNDGVEEVAYWNSGYQYLFTKIDGAVTEVPWFAFPYGYEICSTKAGEPVLKAVRAEYGRELTAYYTLQGTQLYYLDFLRYDPVFDPENPWYICTNAPGQEYAAFSETPMQWKQVTQEEYQQRFDSYPLHFPERLPLSELISGEVPEPSAPEMAEPSMQQAIDGGLDEILAYYRENFPDEDIFYTLHDFDDDGYEDVGIWQDGLFHALHMLNEQGQTKHCWGVAGGFRVCETYYQMVQQVGYEHNILYVYTSYSHEDIGAQVENHTFLRSMSDGVYPREQLQHDPTFDGCEWGRATPENTWTELTTWQPITEKDYNDALIAYQEMEFDLKPIHEDP